MEDDAAAKERREWEQKLREMGLSCRIKPIPRSLTIIDDWSGFKPGRRVEPRMVLRDEDDPNVLADFLNGHPQESGGFA
jgi:hypothetical protein